VTILNIYDCFTFFNKLNYKLFYDLVDKTYIENKKEYYYNIKTNNFLPKYYKYLP